MKLHELLEGVATLQNGLDPEITAMTSDSRKVAPGSCFVAIAGTKADGHEFAAAAERAGAAAIVAQRPLECSIPVVLVEDSRVAYAVMAGNFCHNPARSLRLCGVTGTNGKTSSTFIMKHVLECQGHKVGLVGTIVNCIGEVEEEADNTTPDALELQMLFRRMVDAGCTWCVMEVSSHALDQSRVAGLRFDCAIFTNLTQDHLDYHEDMQSYRQAKQKLFACSDIGVWNFDDPHTLEMMPLSKAPVNVTYSCHSDAADATAKNIKLLSSGIEYQALSKGEISRVAVGMPGGFNVYNTLGVLAAAVALGITQKDAVEALRSCKGVKGRIEVVATDTPYTVIVDYAHTPDALVNIGRALKDFAQGNIITVFGCGGDRDRSKRPLMARAAASFSDYFVLTSDNPRTEDPNRILEDAYAGVKNTTVPHAVILDRTQAIDHALKRAQQDDIVLIAGKGHETYQILGTGKIDFDEREVVARLLEQADS